MNVFRHAITGVRQVVYEETQQQMQLFQEGFRPGSRRLRGTTVAVTLCFLVGILSGSDASYGQVSEIALELDGSDAHVQIDVNAVDLGIAGNAGKSVEVWVYARGFNGNGVFSIGKVGSAGECFGLRTAENVDQWRFDCGGGNYDIDFTHPAKNRWVHLALVHAGSESIVYADGHEIARRARRLKTAAEGPLRIGRCRDATFDGKIAELRIWNRAISELEIKAYMHIPLDGEEEGIVGYWPLNEGAGETATDRVGGYDGRFEGGPTWTLARPFVADLMADEEFRPGRKVVLGPIALRSPQGEPTYQWYRNGRPIEGAAEPSLVIQEAAEEDIGTYHVEVDDAGDLTPVESNRVRLARPDWPMWQYDAARSADTPIGSPKICIFSGFVNCPRPSVRGGISGTITASWILTYPIARLLRAA